MDIVKAGFWKVLAGWGFYYPARGGGRSVIGFDPNRAVSGHGRTGSSISNTLYANFVCAKLYSLHVRFTESLNGAQPLEEFSR